jgi:hypothetical protein
MALVIRGAARPSLLDSYAIERGMADRHVLEVSDETHSLVMDLVAMCHGGGGAPTFPPSDPAKDRAAARRRSMLDVSYAGSALVGRAGSIANGSGIGFRFTACHDLRGTSHHLIMPNNAPCLDYLRKRWEGLVTIIDASQFDEMSDVPAGGAILVRPDGFVGFRADPSDEMTMSALDAHLATYLIPNAAAANARARVASDPH